VPTAPISWGPDWHPYTILGDDTWHDYEVAADVRPGRGERAGVMGRINNVGTGYGIIPKGYVLQLDDTGEVRLLVVRGKTDKAALVGDAEQQALIKAANEAAEGGEKVLATARLPRSAPGRWHRLSLRFEGTHLTGLVDGKPVVQADDALYAAGMAGLLADGPGNGYGMPWFDNVLVGRRGAPLPAPTPALPGQQPLYPHHTAVR
jgi:galactosylceramidase